MPTMSESPYIRNVTQADFTEVVIEGSHRTPVLVDFWAAWCGPCQMLMPVLAKLVEEYQGQVILAKVNSDEQQALAAQYAVRSLPTVKVFKEGQVVDEFMGVQPEPVIREMIERHLVRPSDHLRAEAREREAAGDLAGAVALLRQAADIDPDNPKVQVALAGALLRADDPDGAEKILNALPLNLQQSEEVKGLMGRLRFALIARDAPDTQTLEQRIAAEPGDLRARYQLAARQVANGAFEPAMEQLLEIMRRDRGFESDAGREGLIAVFDMVGGGEAVNRYRRQMFNLLH